MTESRRTGEYVTSNFVRRRISEGLTGTGDSQYEFANELGARGKRAPGEGLHLERPGRASADQEGTIDGE